MPASALTAYTQRSHTRSFADALVLVAYALYTSCYMLTCLDIELKAIPVVGGVFVELYSTITAVLLITALALKPWRWSRAESLGVALIGSVFFISCGLSNNWNLFHFYLFLLAIEDMDYLRLVRVLLWVQLLTLAFCYLSTKLLGTPEAWDLLDGGFYSSRGAHHPNFYSLVVLSIVVCICLTTDRRRYFAPLFVCALASTVFVIKAQASNTAFLLFLALLVALCVERACPRIVSFVCQPWFWRSSAIAIVCAVALLFILAVALYSPDNPLLVAADRALHSRIRLPHSAYEQLGGYPLLGGSLDIWTGSASAARQLGIPLMMLDSAYALHALRSGIAAVVCIVLLYARACTRLSKTNPSFLIWALFLITGACYVMESVSTHLCMSCMPLFLVEGLRPSCACSTDEGRTS